ncbi:MAG: cyclic lactone autoinducer peptide [Peptoniphilus sp.]|nr:cyclic lactone autoinducer peptide [Peptoniphilus sp.]
MKNISLKNILKSVVMLSVKNSANSTTSGTVYQPKAPVALKKFSKIENGK